MRPGTFSSTAAGLKRGSLSICSRLISPADAAVILLIPVATTVICSRPESLSVEWAVFKDAKAATARIHCLFMPAFKTNVSGGLFVVDLGLDALNMIIYQNCLKHKRIFINSLTRSRLIDIRGGQNGPAKWFRLQKGVKGVVLDDGG